MVDWWWNWWSWWWWWWLMMMMMIWSFWQWHWAKTAELSHKWAHQYSWLLPADPDWLTCKYKYRTQRDIEFQEHNKIRIMRFLMAVGGMMKMMILNAKPPKDALPPICYSCAMCAFIYTYLSVASLFMCSTNAKLCNWHCAYIYIYYTPFTPFKLHISKGNTIVFTHQMKKKHSSSFQMTLFWSSKRLTFSHVPTKYQNILSSFHPSNCIFSWISK